MAFSNLRSLGLFLYTLGMLVACQPPVAPAGNQEPPSSDTSLRMVKDTFEGQSLVVVGSLGRNFMVSYYTTLADGTPLDLEISTAGFPAILIDQEGNIWDIWGNAIKGPRTGETLVPTYGYMGYWFGFVGIFPDLERYGESGGSQKSLYDDAVAGDWKVPTNEVFFGTGRDGIQSIDNPEYTIFSNRSEIDGSSFFLDDNDLVIGVKVGDELKLFPHAVLDWHEIANDVVGTIPLAVIYCPLTGTAQGWNRRVAGEITTFGVSGLLYSNNILPYDRFTESIWSQMRQEGINGSQLGVQPDLINVIELPWKQWREFGQELSVLKSDRRDFPYGTYRTNHDLIFFPQRNTDNRFANKTRVHGVIINGKARIYAFEDLL